MWTVQEEIGLQGARLLNLGLLGKPRHAFNWDGGAARKLTIGATGGYRMQIDIMGKASHAGGAPEAGSVRSRPPAWRSVVCKQSGWHGAICQGGRSGTSNVGVIQGGNATNVVADHVLLLAEARSHDAEFRQQIVQQIRVRISSGREPKRPMSRASRRGSRSKVDWTTKRFVCLPTIPVFEAAEQAVRRVGGEPELAVANGGLDANWLTSRGIPTVSLGCGQIGQHTVDEALDLDEFRTACRIALELATHRS